MLQLISPTIIYLFIYYLLSLSNKQDSIKDRNLRKFETMHGGAAREPAPNTRYMLITQELLSTRKVRKPQQAISVAESS
jgi:hypothetical protein